MLTRHAITKRADIDGVDAASVERDYVLAHIVSQLHLAKLGGAGRLAFKGGTALRFVHFSDYRYSADLDFSVLDSTSEQAVTAMTAVLDAARKQSEVPLLELSGGVTPVISYIGPLLSSRVRRIKLDISENEYVMYTEQRVIQQNLWEDLPQPYAFEVYTVEEIAAEKLRCIIQRVQCRDLYDLYRLVQDTNLSLMEISNVFEKKLLVKGLEPAIFSERFNDRIIRYEKRWNIEMNEHLQSPPQFETVARIVRRRLRLAGLLED